MRRILFLVIASAFLSGLHAQRHPDTSKANVSYFRKVFTQQENSKNHLLMIGYHYMLSPVGKTFGAQGMVPNVGINLGRLFSHQIIVGLSLDLKLIKGFSNKRLSPAFVSDFNTNFNPHYDNPTDSVNAYTVKTAINGGPGHFLTGNNLSNVGIMLSLFPQKLGGILIQIKKGYRSFGINGLYGIREIHEGANDVVSIGIPADWVYEISCKPLAFFRDTYVRKITDFRGESLANCFTISLFYERLDFREANFNGTGISQMTSAAFINKYKTDNRFGFKLGFSFY
jgi:hypothetical protein